MDGAWSPFCFLAAVFMWGLGVFGASVYLHEVTKARGWSVSLVSAGITRLLPDGGADPPCRGRGHRSSRPASRDRGRRRAAGARRGRDGHVAAPWQLYAAFVCMGLGYATMSVTGLSATIAPWFEGFCLGQITTLSPIVVRREFGAASFGAATASPAR